MTDDILYQIQTMQFRDKSAAEQLLVNFIRDTFALPVRTVELRPLAVSLNSFNGFLTLDDEKKLFFKTHAEPDTVIAEYYNARRLADAGYPVIQPVFSSTEAGKQLLIYEVITAPSVFDVAWDIENGDKTYFDALTEAQNHADDLLFQYYQETIAFQDANDAALAPIHQLFFHRLVGGRLERFYGALPGQNGDSHHIKLPSGEFNMHSIRQVKWQINGQFYAQNLDEMILNAIHLLNPLQSGISVIGHGDAHNGNVFFEANAIPPSLLYFDPAFAGRHDPLLDIVKPLFHNIFAMWMYFPADKARDTHIRLQTADDKWIVEHDYRLHPIRLMFLRSKIDRVITPLLHMLKKNEQLRSDWRTYLKCALFCCPFLTMNLTDQQKFTPEISLLGLVMSIEMGCESNGKRSQIDLILDEINQSIV
ncbi:MAG: hypothetical protein ABI690_07250 [Chloroflexota bacterium]